MKTRKGDFDSALVDAFEAGKLQSSRYGAQEIQAAKEAAANYLRKDARINIRLAGPDLRLLKRKAAEEGIPYQTLIASLLHKYVTGRLL